MSKFCGGCGTALAGEVRFCESCGKPVARPAGQGASPAPPPPAPEFTAPPPSKRPLVVAGLVLGVLVLFGVTVSVVQAVLFSPKATVRAFFADLADGEGASASERLDGTPSDAQLLSDKVLASKTYVAPTDVEVSEVEGGGKSDDDSRQVKVSYVLDGKRAIARLSLDRDEDRSLLFFRKWRIDDGTATLTMPSGVPYQVNGVAVAKSGEQNTQEGTDAVAMLSLALFPGRYDVGVAENPLLSGEEKQVTLKLDAEPTRLALSPTIKESAKTEVGKQVNAYVDECAKETTVQPENCPFSTYGGSDARNVKWSVVTYPTISFRQSDGGSVYIETTQEDAGSATVTYESKSYFSGGYESQTSSSPITVGGSVVVKDGKIDWMSPKDFAEKNGDGD